MKPAEISYLRIRIHGELTSGSPLHVGSGASEPLKDRDRTRPASATEPEKGQYTAVCLNHPGLPYLPGSTLRGFLREQAHRGGDQPLEGSLFGYIDDEPGENEAKKAHAGALRIYDAPLRCAPNPGDNRLWHPDRGTLIRQSVALAPITLTADEHKLFSHEYLPTGSRFAFTLEAENLREGELATILGLLEAWNGGVESTVGRGASRMQGRLAWTLERIDVLDAAGLARWLASDEPLETFLRPLEPPKSSCPASTTKVCSARFRVHPLSPVLVNDPGYVRRKPKQGGPPENENAPDLEFSRTPDGRPVIPAASLRGLVRGRARKILATLLAERGVPAKHAGDEAGRLADTLFGHEKNRSPVWLGDAVADTAAAPHRQYFNAVDRFTGGVAEGKLYQVEARTGGVYAGEMAVEAERLAVRCGGWWKGLLFLVLRDALEGDLAVGWGKARGYGAFRVAVEWEGRWIEDWPGLLNYVDEKPDRRESVQRWIDALHDELDRAADEIKNREAKP